MELAGVHGDRQLEAVTLRDLASGIERTQSTAALFVFIGAKPHTGWLGDAVARDAEGHVITGPHLLRGRSRPAGWKLGRDPLWLESSVPGVFAAGDVRHRSARGIAAAVGEGAMAMQQIRQHLGGAALIPPPRQRPQVSSTVAGLAPVPATL